MGGDHYPLGFWSESYDLIKGAKSTGGGKWNSTFNLPQWGSLGIEAHHIKLLDA